MVQSDVPSLYMPTWGGKQNLNQECLYPHQDLNPGYLAYKTVVLITRFNAKTVVFQSYRLHKGRSGPNYPRIWTTAGKSCSIFNTERITTKSDSVTPSSLNTALNSSLLLLLLFLLSS
jgi:hypothetical protein